MSSRRWSPARHAGRVAGGAAALRAGRSFEEELEATHDSAEYSALCAMSRAYPPVGGPPGALFYRGKGKVDFVGHVLGVPVAFDVKSNNAEASYHHDPRDCHELDFLLTWRARGGVSFLLVLDRSIDTLYLVDDVARLRAGANVQLRTHARGRAVPAPVVPALVRTEVERTLAAVRSAPIWPWLQLAAAQYPAIARALGLEPRRPPDVS
jgi:hypothetical protein